MKQFLQITFLISLLLSCSPQTSPGSFIGEKPGFYSDSIKKTPYLNKNELNNYLKSVTAIEKSAVGTPFDYLDYNQIVAYKYENSGDRNPVVYDKRFGLIAVIEKQHAFNQKQADQFLQLVASKKTYGGMRMSCFEPRLGIVFYKDGKYIDQISVCMECNYLESELIIPAYERQQKRSEKSGYNARTDYGFSRSGRKGLEEMLQEFGFN